jgi:hypothetical protein
MITEPRPSPEGIVTATGDSNANQSHPAGGRPEDRVPGASWASAALSIAKSLITVLRYKAVSTGLIGNRQ